MPRVKFRKILNLIDKQSLYSSSLLYDLTEVRIDGDKRIYRSSNYFTKMQTGNCDETIELPALSNSETQLNKKYIIYKKNINQKKEIYINKCWRID